MRDFKINCSLVSDPRTIIHDKTGCKEAWSMSYFHPSFSWMKAFVHLWWDTRPGFRGYMHVDFLFFFLIWCDYPKDNRTGQKNPTHGPSRLGNLPLTRCENTKREVGGSVRALTPLKNCPFTLYCWFGLLMLDRPLLSCKPSQKSHQVFEEYSLRNTGKSIPA